MFSSITQQSLDLQICLFYNLCKIKKYEVNEILLLSFVPKIDTLGKYPSSLGLKVWLTVYPVKLVFCAKTFNKNSWHTVLSSKILF